MFSAENQVIINNTQRNLQQLDKIKIPDFDKKFEIYLSTY